MRLLFYILFCFPMYCFAQIVNIENQRLGGKEEGFDGNIELNLNFTMNTKQLLQIGDKMKFGYRKKRHHTFILADHAFVKSDDDDFINRGYQHLRYNYTLKDSGKIILEAFQQSQFNKIQKINLRFLLGSGFRFVFVDKKNYQLSFGTGFMAEYEELIDYGESRDLLSTSYLSFDAQFTPNVGINTITYIQPKMIDFGHYRFSNETHIRFHISKHLSYKIIYSVIHDSRDIPDVRKTNYNLKNTLSFSF